MIWNVPRIWPGGEVWILGGGPSVTEQFGIPDEVVKDVVMGRTSPNIYSPYMSAIHARHVIGVNVAYQIGDWIDIVFFGDEGFYNHHAQALADFPGLKVSSHPLADKLRWVKYCPQSHRHSYGLVNNHRDVSWNGNSGSAAINLAVNLGAKRIILLGFDMKLGKDRMQHWHDLYKRGPYTPPPPGKRGPHDARSLPFEKHLRGMAQVGQDARHLGVEIINASPNSAIKEFKKATVKELIS